MWQIRTYFRVRLDDKNPLLKRPRVRKNKPTIAHSAPAEAKIVNVNDEPTPTVNPAPVLDPNPHVAPEPIVPTEPVTTQSGRTSRPPERLIQVMTLIINYDGTHE